MRLKKDSHHVNAIRDSVKKLKTEEPIEGDLLFMPSLEGDEKKSRRTKKNKNINSKNLFTRLPVLLAQIKAGKNSYKLVVEMLKK